MVVKSCMIHLKIVRNKTVILSKYFFYHKFVVWINDQKMIFVECSKQFKWNSYRFGQH